MTDKQSIEALRNLKNSLEPKDLDNWYDLAYEKFKEIYKEDSLRLNELYEIIVNYNADPDRTHGSEESQQVTKEEWSDTFKNFIDTCIHELGLFVDREGTLKRKWFSSTAVTIPLTIGGISTIIGLIGVPVVIAIWGTNVSNKIDTADIRDENKELKATMVLKNDSITEAKFGIMWLDSIATVYRGLLPQHIQDSLNKLPINPPRKK